ncbi:primosomal protein N' family DNA-binding protein, partial [Petrachloros mirabilis]
MPAQSNLNGLYADVIIPRHLSGPFTYRVPLSMGTSLRVGHLVLVPFGRSYVRGAVASITQTPPSHIASEQLKDIHALDAEGLETEIPPNLFRLAQSVAESYAAPLGQCLRLILPSAGQARRAANLLRLTDSGKKAVLSESDDQTPVLKVLKRLNRRPSGMRRTTLLGRGRLQGKLVDSLIEKGWIEEVHESSNGASSVHGNATAGGRNAIVSSPGGSAAFLRSPALHEWKTRLIEFLDDRKASRLLLQCLSSERLTLLRLAVEHAVRSGRTAMVIVGDRERAESIASLLSRIGSMKCGCLHSGLSDRQKGEIWSQIRQARVEVVVGTRSAVFAPLQSIGLIWIEREEDPALKEPQEPRYHAREVAWIRAQEEQALLIISSTHLTLETSWNVSQREHVMVRPPWQVGAPAVELIDPRDCAAATH